MIQLLYLYMILKNELLNLLCVLMINWSLYENVLWKACCYSIIFFSSGWTGKRQKNNLDCHILCCMVTSECYFCSNFLRNFISVCVFIDPLQISETKQCIHSYLYILALAPSIWNHSKNILTWTLINSFL